MWKVHVAIQQKARKVSIQFHRNTTWSLLTHNGNSLLLPYLVSAMWMEKGRNKHAINSLCVYKKNQQHMQVTQHLRYKFVLEKLYCPFLHIWTCTVLFSHCNKVPTFHWRVKQAELLLGKKIRPPAHIKLEVFIGADCLI